MSSPTPTSKGLRGYLRSLEALYPRMRDATAEARVRLLKTGAPGTEEEIAFAAVMKILHERADGRDRGGDNSFVRGMKIGRMGACLLAVQDEKIIGQLFGDSPARSRPGAGRPRREKKGLTADSRREMLSKIDDLVVGSVAEFPPLPSGEGAAKAPLSALDVLKRTLAPAPAADGLDADADAPAADAPAADAPAAAAPAADAPAAAADAPAADAPAAAAPAADAHAAAADAPAADAPAESQSILPADEKFEALAANVATEGNWGDDSDD